MKMQKLKRNWHIEVLHHSHTDIGYTERQELICRQHADFLRQVLDILRRVDAGEAEEQRGFCWQCENYWQIENFLLHASEKDAEDLIRYVRAGRIGLSASYLNLTDLIDETVLEEHLQAAREWADGVGATMKSAMTADVNGYSPALPDALSAAGVQYFYSALHTHHGMYPLHHNPAFFRWHGPHGGSVLTFVGEHYHWGHVLGLCPHGTSSYMLNDDLLWEIESGKRFTTDAETTEQEEIDLAAKRITRYLAGLEEFGWPLDFVPVFVSGIYSDNSPPNGRVAERVNRLNALFGGNVTLEMTTLDSFFEKLEASGTDIPEYSGDFTDWWADGVGSTPEAIKIYREAQRKRNLAALLDPEKKSMDRELWRKSGRNMMLYAEHTWGHSASVSDPYKSLVSEMGLKKTAYAVNANTEAGALLDGVLEHLGNCVLYPDRSLRFRVLNPYPFSLSAPVAVPLLGWEYPFGCAQKDIPLSLSDAATGEILPTRTGPGPRGRLAETALTLNPGESRELQLSYLKANREMPAHTAWMCADAVWDLEEIKGLTTPAYIETQFFIIRTDPQKGVASILYRETGTELMDRLSPYGAFACVYEVTPASGPQTSSRRRMGRSRQTVNTREYPARPVRFAVTEQNDASVTLQIAYSLEGTEECSLSLKIWNLLPRIDVVLRIRKKSCPDAEGIRMALPFVTDGENETWIDKTGCVMRPGIDQLPGTCQEFWCLQNGAVRRGKTFDLVVGTPDVPLISFGEGNKGPVTLCDGHGTDLNRATIFSRVMNNFWETNFAVDLGGWHEFRYFLTVSPPDTPENQLRKCAALSTGLPVISL